VREQLRIACGHPLSVRQEDLRITGHAVEARIYAEDPAAGFLPATGELVAWAPAKDPGVRVDSGVETGSVVGVDFDPMLAKVIAHAPTRSEAVRRLALALERSIIRGPVTNRDFLVATLRHPTFLAGKATTAFVETSGVATTRPVSRAELEVAAVGAALCGVAEARPGLGIRSSVRPGWRNSILPPESVEFEHITGRIRVGLRTSRDGSSVVTVNESHHTVRREDFVRVSGVGDRAPELCGSLCFAMDGRDHTLQVGHYGQTWWLQGPDGDVRLVEILRFPEPAREAVAGGLIAPMNGSVLSVQVRVGQVVVPGDLLMVIEAMKMEHRITASVSGTVRDIRVAEGEQVAGGDVLVVLDEEVGR
jgi:propionyl-CoA carboxylase alpha chain